MVLLSKSGKVKGFKLGNILGKANKGRKCTWGKKISKTLRRKYENPKFKETHGFQEEHKFLGNLSKANFFQKGFTPWNKGLTKEEDERVAKGAENTSKAIKELWKNNEEYRENNIHATLKALLKRPTSLETNVIDIIQRNNLPYKYVGDGSFLIGFKNPDFINTNGEKICVEVQYPYFKEKMYQSRERYEKLRAKYFSSWGWKTIFLWGNRKLELSEQQIINILTSDNVAGSIPVD